MKRIIIFSLLLCMTLLSAGCWDIRDISNRAFVTAIGLDVAEDEPAKYKVTFEIINPAELKRQHVRPAAVVETVKAESIDRAIELMQAQIPRTITLAHLRLVLLGDELARQDFHDPLSFIDKHPEVAKRVTMVLVQEGQAQEILMAKPRFERTVSAEFIAMTQLDRDLSLVRTRRFYNFVHDLRSTGGTAFKDRLYLSKNGEFLVREGGAVFHHWRLAGWLSNKETQAANWIVGKAARDTVEGKTSEGVYTYEVLDQSVSITPVVEDGQPSFTLELTTVGMLLEEQGQQLDLTDPRQVEKLEQVFSRIIAADVREAIHKSQREFGIDYFGFGQVLRQQDPKAFDRLNWEETYPDVPVKVMVESRIKWCGLAR